MPCAEMHIAELIHHGENAKDRTNGTERCEYDRLKLTEAIKGIAADIKMWLPSLAIGTD